MVAAARRWWSSSNRGRKRSRRPRSNTEPARPCVCTTFGWQAPSSVSCWRSSSMAAQRRCCKIRSRRSSPRTLRPHTAPLRPARADRTRSDRERGQEACHRTRRAWSCEVLYRLREAEDDATLSARARRALARALHARANESRAPAARRSAPRAIPGAQHTHIHSIYLTSTTDPGVVDRCAG